MKIQINVTFLCMALVCLVSVMLLTQTPIVAAGSGDGHCKELSKRGKGEWQREKLIAVHSQVHN